MEFKEQFRNLLIMAAADGAMSEAELRLLSDRAVEWGITDDEFEQAIHYALTSNPVLQIPSDEYERRIVLKDLVRMMAADGQMSDSEKKLFATLSAVLNMTGVELNSLIDEVLDET
jgi:hypothetical protein